jgi:phosphoribosyl 1,2-cyclic phosphate phosphodiesterase
MGVTLFDVDHGRMPCSGIRIGPIAYTPDVNGLNDAAKGMLSGVSIWVVDALREKPHPSHAHLDQSLQWLETIKPDIGILTNLHVDMDYRTLTRSLPNNVRPGFDGLSFAYDDQINSVIYIDPV